jgi:diguanylate cyclase
MRRHDAGDVVEGQMVIDALPAEVASIAQRLRLEADLRAALGAGELEVVYQPIVDLDIDDIVGVEALARWRHPDLGVIEPAVIPVAEETGLMHTIGGFVIEHACAQFAAGNAQRAMGRTPATKTRSRGEFR